MVTIIPEYWLRGPVPGMIPVLQPVAHALLQAREEVSNRMENFPSELLWERPFGLASPGFHLQHLRGVLDRLFTYARNEALNGHQLDYLRSEGVKPSGFSGTSELVQLFSMQVEEALNALKMVGAGELASPRSVGRQQIPTTLIGLLIHAAEHTTRHTGQLLVLSVLIFEGSKSVGPSKDSAKPE